MNKENVLFSIVGVLVGFIVGFVFANTANRGGLAPQAAVPAATQRAEGLPEGHPPVDPSQARPQVDEATLSAAVKLAQEQPENYEAQVALGNMLFDAERLPEAEKWYTAALRKNPKDVNVRTDLGLTFLLREPAQYDRAIAEFKRSLEVEPTHPQTLQNLTVAYTRKGDIAAAEETLAKLKAAAPQSPAVEQLRSGIDKAKSATPAETSAVKAVK
jgi:tetratricopeptide (TPR) repeat protein